MNVAVRIARMLVVVSSAVLALSGARCERSGSQAGAEDLRLGYETYMANCAACHGDHGAGDGPLAEPLAVELGVAPLRLDPGSRASQLDRDEIHDVIARGGSKTGRSNLMPAWGNELDPESVQGVTDYVMALSHRIPMPPEETIREYFASPPGSAEDGRKLYVYYCSACHGPQGEGDGQVSPTLLEGRRPRDLTNEAFMQEKSDQDLYTAIALGGRHAGLSSAMPGWTYEMSPEQIRSVISYIRVISGTTQAD